MSYRPELEGPVTAATLPSLKASVPASFDGTPAEQIEEREDGTLVFQRNHQTQKRGIYVQKFTLHNSSGNVSIVELNEQTEPAEDVETVETVEAPADEVNGDLLNVTFASEAAFDLATSNGLKAADFTGKG